MNDMRYDVAVAGAAAFIARQLDGDHQPSARRSTDSAPHAARATEGAI